MGVRLSRSLLDRILAEACATPAQEICGLLFGEENFITATVPALNIHPEPDRYFELDPAALIAAHKAARDGGPRIIGHYHSHPSGSLAASRADEDGCEEGGYCLILAGGRARLHQAQAGRLVVVELILID